MFSLFKTKQKQTYVQNHFWVSRHFELDTLHLFTPSVLTYEVFSRFEEIPAGDISTQTTGLEPSSLFFNWFHFFTAEEIKFDDRPRTFEFSDRLTLFQKTFSPKLKTNLYRELLLRLPAGAICVKMPTLKMTAIAWSIFIHCFQSKTGFVINAPNFES